MIKLFTRALSVREFYSLHTLTVKSISDDFVLAVYHRGENTSASMEGNFRRGLFNGEIKIGDKYSWRPAKDGSMGREDFERIAKQ